MRYAIYPCCGAETHTVLTTLDPMTRLIPLLLAAITSTLVIAESPRPRTAPPPRPKLLVLLSVDQLRADYATMYGDRWTAGLRRLYDQGASFPLAAFPYQNTVTCAGHATIGTGAFPATHGLPINGWWDREARKVVACTDDADVISVPYRGTGTRPSHSAHFLKVPTFADELRAQSAARPRVVSLSLKPRSAIMMAGHAADLMLWYGGAQGWSSSTAFAAAPVPFVKAFIDANPIERDAGAAWTRTLPDSAYRFADEGPGEDPPSGWSATFPHVLPGSPGQPAPGFYETWPLTPLADVQLGQLAAEAMRGFGLGKGPGTDFLAVSFSTLDYTGHAFGPHSHEVQDVLFRLDRTIGTLLDAIDRLVGRDHYIVALTGDHGVAPLPEHLETVGLEGGRVPAKELIAKVNAALAPFLGEGSHVARLIYTDLYLADGVYDRIRDNGDALRAVSSAVLTVPAIARVVRGEDLPARRGDADPLVRAAALSYVPGRSGDLVVIPNPYWQNSTTGTTHGTAYAYDQRVPVVLAGAGIAPGTYLVAATPADIVTTFAWLTGVTLPRADGRVLVEALAPRTTAPARSGATMRGTIDAGAVR